jgi:hypothetical protein
MSISTLQEIEQQKSGFFLREASTCLESCEVSISTN